MIIGISGTPGCGKTTLASELVEKGFEIVTVEDLAAKFGALSGDEVDVELLDNNFERPSGDLIIEGHLAHYLGPDICIVLRCHPEVLEKRLGLRDYTPEKMRENVEAEAIDLILAEAAELNQKVYEIDTTNMSIDRVAEAALRIISGDTAGYEPGKVDWSEVILEWY